MSENKINNKAFIPYLISCILYLASYLIYVLVPSSELANGLDHPGITAVYVLTASPVLAVAALALFIFTFVANKEHLNKLLSKSVVIASFGIMSVMIAVSVIFAVYFIAFQYKLGFAAPIYNTKWSSYSVYILISVILQFASLVVLTLKMNGIIKK